MISKNQSKIFAAVTLAFLLASLGFSGVIIVPVTEGATAQVYFSAASFGSSGYAVDETATINAKVKWEGLTANVTVSIQLWNTTDHVETLESYTVPYNVSGTLTPTGSNTRTYTPATELTEEVGTTTYTLKMFSGGLLVDSDPITLVVASSQLTMSITWQDQNNDRTVEPNELVTFTGYINWAFVETTEAHSLYVNYGDGDQLLSNIAVTAGSGSQTVTDSHGFNTAGAKSAVFTLKDATGTAVKASSVAITVGTPATTTPPPAQTSIVGMIVANWAILAIVGAAIAVGYIYLGDKPKRR